MKILCLAMLSLSLLSCNNSGETEITDTWEYSFIGDSLVNIEKHYLITVHNGAIHESRYSSVTDSSNYLSLEFNTVDTTLLYCYEEYVLDTIISVTTENNKTENFLLFDLKDIYFDAVGPVALNLDNGTLAVYSALGPNLIFIRDSTSESNALHLRSEILKQYNMWLTKAIRNAG